MAQAETLASGLLSAAYRKAEQAATERVESLRQSVASDARAIIGRVGIMTPEQESAEAEQASRAETERLWRCSRIPAAQREFIDSGEPISGSVPEWRDTLRQVCRMCKPARVGATIALLGSNGNGKTQLAAFVAWHFAKTHRSSRYVRAMDLFDSLHDARKADSERLMDVIKGYSAPALLIIDEIDKRSGTDYEFWTFCRVIDERYSAGRHTLMLGNYTVEGFHERMDHSIVSRMGESGAVIFCDWKSFRTGGAA